MKPREKPDTARPPGDMLVTASPALRALVEKHGIEGALERIMADPDAHIDVVNARDDH